MKLYSNPASPFVRKVRVVAHELGLSDAIELLPVATTPVSPNASLAEVNPLGKIPALALDDGTVLYDSRVIAEYLDAVHGGHLHPRSGPSRWAALRFQAAADGLLDAAILVRYERGFRPAELQSASWVDGQMQKLRRTLGRLEAEAAGFTEALTIGTIAVGCALGYLDFRFPEERWRDAYPALDAFYRGFAERPSMVATKPPAA